MMMKNSPKKKRSDTFTAAQVGVLVEDFRSQFRVFGEGMDLLNNRFGGLERRVDGIANRLEDVRINQAMTLERVTRLEISVTGLKSDVSVLKSDVSGLKSDGTSLKRDMASLKATTAQILVDTTDIKKIAAGHENRIARLEAGKL
ncbi:MAG: hypothetical protein A3C36_00340 [Omnitrophica WOR_2 bacterium RIFCSPHIGHO2_02_FULL_52_10]|nr:MAG: hypothetical protein A3C36_00340 [Omnitrophica WOR_2 bacterium RIFCSPHIGHO2_02_FULL_52_10]